MGAESSAGIQNFNSEVLSRSFSLEEKFRKSGVLGEKQDDESMMRANVEVSRILNTSFSVGNVAETQENPILNYETVSHMIEIVHNDGRGGGSGLLESVRKNAENALYEVGLALSQNKEVFKAATEGEEALKKVLPSNLEGIEPYLLSSYLTKGRDDVEGQKNIVDLVEIFKLKKKAEAQPGLYKTDFDEKKKALFDRLFEASDEAGSVEVADGTVGRLELMMGYITGIDRGSKNPVIVETNDVDKKFAAAAEKMAVSAEKMADVAEVLRISKIDKSLQGGDFSDYEPPVFNSEKNEWTGGSRWELSPEYTAMAMKYMDYSMRWQSYTPPEWVKDLDLELQKRIERMVAVNLMAAGLLHAGKDLDKILGNEVTFEFRNNQMTELFNDDFKLVTSKMLNDLCEFYFDQNGVRCLRYKEKFYKLAEKDKDGNYIGNHDGSFFLGADGKREVIPFTVENRGKGINTIDQDVMYKLTHIQDYEDDLALFLSNEKQKEVDKKALVDGLAARDNNGDVWMVHQEDNNIKGVLYKKGDFILDRLGKKISVDAGSGIWAIYAKDKGNYKKGEFILDKKGNRIPGYLSKMNAYTAYNLAFGMGDTSLWDRTRVLPTYTGIISDALRTLNPEYKAKSKWQILKSGRIKNTEDLFDAEYFSGNLADYYLEVSKLERDLGRPIDGVKTIRQKVLDGELSLLSSKTVYGFFDFVNTGRDIYDSGMKELKEKKGQKSSLGELLMDYASFNSNGTKRMIDKNNDFSFGDRSVTFLNEFRDSLEAAILAYRCMTGKIEVKDPAVWARDLKDKMSNVNAIEFFNKKVFSYDKNPAFWRDAIIGSFGYDPRRLSSNYPYLLRETLDKEGTRYDSYSAHIYTLLRDKFKLSNTDININELMRLLGVRLDQSENPNTVGVINRNKKIEKQEITQTMKLKNQVSRKTTYDRMDYSEASKEYKVNIPDLIDEVRSLNTYKGNEEFDRMRRSFETLLKSGAGFEGRIVDLANAILKFKP
jgi:hypothetical protein